MSNLQGIEDLEGCEFSEDIEQLNKLKRVLQNLIASKSYFIHHTSQIIFHTSHNFFVEK